MSSKDNQYHFKEYNVKRNEPQWAVHSDIPDVLHNVSFFKHYTPQLTHNCCPCHTNYAAFDVNSDSMGLNKAMGVEKPGVITKVIPVDRGRK